MAGILQALELTKEVWNTIPEEYQEKITKAVAEDQINLAKQILAKIPSEFKVIKGLISEAEWSNLFSSGFNLETFTQKAELRGLIGKEFWTDEMLRMPLARYKRHVVAEGIAEDKADVPIQGMAKRLNLDLNYLRRLFYGIEKTKGKSVETPKQASKPEPENPSTTEKEEIVIEGAKEE
jgi:hypothetical protein